MRRPRIRSGRVLRGLQGIFMPVRRPDQRFGEQRLRNDDVWIHTTLRQLPRRYVLRKLQGRQGRTRLLHQHDDVVELRFVMKLRQLMPICVS